MYINIIIIYRDNDILYWTASEICLLMMSMSESVKWILHLYACFSRIENENNINASTYLLLFILTGLIYVYKQCNYTKQKIK